MEIKRLLDEFSEDVIRAFVGKNSDYYLNKWRLMAATGSKTSWNWAAFSFVTLWMAYRKMYLYAFITMVISVLNFIPIIGFIFSLIIWFGVGIFGNYLYGKFTYEKLTALKLAYGDGEALKQAAILNGGTSVLSVFLFILLGFFIGFMAILSLSLIYGLRV